METCLQRILPGDVKKNQKIYSAKVSYCQNLDIRIIFRQNSDFGIIK